MTNSIQTRQQRKIDTRIAKVDFHKITTENPIPMRSQGLLALWVPSLGMFVNRNHLGSGIVSASAGQVALV